MKTLLIAVNSKFIHSSLALWYLKENCSGEAGEIKVVEYTINDHIDAVIASIYEEKADILAFSCYIWNISTVLRLAKTLKKISKNIKIILGGPEVSFNPVEVMEENPFIDYILSGEGDFSLSLLLSHLNKSSQGVTVIEGVSYRLEDTIVSNKPAVQIKELDTIKSPYTNEMLNTSSKKIVYYESSRGCPFSCSYCISSTCPGVRFFSLERVYEDLKKIISHDVAQIKFLDRTFNCNQERAKKIFLWILHDLLPEITAQKINFHFEIAADLMDAEMLDILETAPEGLIQLEIGIQSTNTTTLLAVNRVSNLDKAFLNIERLRKMNSINIHLDLIAGLPYEGLDSFRKSFNEVYRLGAHQFQLGFLKLLKGSKIRKEASLHEYLFREDAPYEVLCNKYISFEEIILLKGIEELVERYLNSGKFSHSLQWIIGNLYPSPFSFFEDFLSYHRSKNLLYRALSLREQYSVLEAFMGTIVSEEKIAWSKELLKLDFLSSDRSSNLPEGLNRKQKSGFKEYCFEFLKNEENVANYLPMYKGLPAKEIYKKVHFEIFTMDVLQENLTPQNQEVEIVILFNYGCKNRVSGRYEYRAIGDRQGAIGKPVDS